MDGRADSTCLSTIRRMHLNARTSTCTSLARATAAVALLVPTLVAVRGYAQVPARPLVVSAGPSFPTSFTIDVALPVARDTSIALGVGLPLSARGISGMLDVRRRLGGSPSAFHVDALLGALGLKAGPVHGEGPDAVGDPLGSVLFGMMVGDGRFMLEPNDGDIEALWAVFGVVLEWPGTWTSRIQIGATRLLVGEYDPDWREIRLWPSVSLRLGRRFDL